MNEGGSKITECIKLLRPIYIYMSLFMASEILKVQEESKGKNANLNRHRDS